jgi:hypothetical protein
LEFGWRNEETDDRSKGKQSKGKERKKESRFRSPRI